MALSIGCISLQARNCESFTANNHFPLKTRNFSPLNALLYTVVVALIREYFLIFVGLEARSSDVDVYHQIYGLLMLLSPVACPLLISLLSIILLLSFFSLGIIHYN